MSDARVRTVVTGLGWMGAGIGSIDSAVEEVVRSARREIIIVAYAWGDGADRMIQLIREALRGGVQVRVIVDRLAGQYGRVPFTLQELARDYSDQCRVYDFEGNEDNARLHAKLLVADRRRAIVGSANLSWHGLVTYHELAVVIEGDAVAEIAGATDRLVGQAFVREITPGGDGSTGPHSAGTTSDPRTAG